MMYTIVDNFQPGLSWRRVRRRANPAVRDVAELYAQLSMVEGRMAAMNQATAIRFGEVQQDLNRLESNGNTQRKYFGQEMAQIELQTQLAMDRAQVQIDNLRQQTSDIHSLVSSIHTHSAALTDGLRAMMQSFRDLRFDMPNAFDNWMRMRAEGGRNGTVSAMELHHQPWATSN